MDRWGISAFPYPDREELQVAEKSNIRESTLHITNTFGSFLGAGRTAARGTETGVTEATASDLQHLGEIDQTRKGRLATRLALPSHSVAFCHDDGLASPAPVKNNKHCGNSIYV